MTTRKKKQQGPTSLLLAFGDSCGSTAASLVTTAFRILVVVLVTFSYTAFGAVVDLDCDSDEQCMGRFGSESFCTERGTCSNPFQGGCLRARLPDWKRKRTCGSQDPKDAVDRGLCLPSPLNYTEIRIESQNWESALFHTWILQILLTEMLDVPVSIETSFFEYVTNFYDEHMRVEYGWSDDERALARATRVDGDCVPFTSQMDGYLACAHYIPQSKTSARWTPEFIANKTLEPTQSCGTMGMEGWYIPLHTAQIYPELRHYSALVGEENRHKLARIFRRPITWVQYCEWVSPHNCSKPDHIASGFPEQRDWWKFHVPGNFQGHFIDTEENNCTKYPSNCTGDFIDFPCGWSSYALPTLYHLNIGLRSYGANGPPKGYWKTQIDEIWRAANATKEHVMMMFLKPDPLYTEFVGTDYAFTRVMLPEPTAECERNRRRHKSRCEEDRTFEERMGDPKGTCDEPPSVLQKIYSTSLRHITVGDHIPPALRSPAYEALTTFTLSDLQIEEMFEAWIEKGRDINFASRETVCDWVIENLDFVKSFIPEGYPREPVPSTTTLRDPIFATALALGLVSVIAVIAATATTYVQRKKSVIEKAQHHFLASLLVGLLLLSIGAVLGAIPPNDAVCISQAYFVNMGYSVELVPLVVKTAALNRVMSAGRKMRRVSIKLSSLLLANAVIGSLVLVMLVVWTVLDPPLQQYDYILGATVVTTMSVNSEHLMVEQVPLCGSESNTWWILSVSWQLFLLLIATILAFQNRHYRQDLVDTRTLAMMIYSHMVFSILRCVSYAFEGSVENASSVRPFRSLIYSVDVLTCIAIYFVPKFLDKSDNRLAERSVHFFRSGSFDIDISGQLQSSGDRSLSNNGVNFSRPSNEIGTGRRIDGEGQGAPADNSDGTRQTTGRTVESPQDISDGSFDAVTEQMDGVPDVED